ncbi:hypothetical protein TNIN_124321, partial [Trichonephila inaurata madagascariensis]
ESSSFSQILAVILKINELCENLYLQKARDGSFSKHQRINISRWTNFY